MSHRSGVFGLPDRLPPAVKYALVYLFVQAEFGLCCPLSMTDSLTRTLVKFGDPELAAEYFDQLASGEITIEGAVAHLVGDPGQGFKQMTDMINMSRLANGVRSAGMMRRAVAESLFIARNRTAFGKHLIDLPLMRRQLLKMLVTAEQGRSMVFHTAEVLRRTDAGDAQAATRRGSDSSSWPSTNLRLHNSGVEQCQSGRLRRS